MFTKSELLDIMEELENSPKTFQNIQKLATFYSIYDHLYGGNIMPVQETVRKEVVDDYGDTDFLQAVAGADAREVFMIMDEMVTVIQTLQPRLYEASLQKLRELL